MLQYCTATKILRFKSPTATSVPSPSWAYPLVSLPSTLTLARIYELLVPGPHPEGPMQGLTGKPSDWCLFFLAGSDREHRQQLPWQPNTPYPQAGSNATPALTAWKPLAQRRRAGASPCPRVNMLAVSRATHTEHPSTSAGFCTKPLLQRKISQTCCCNRYHTACQSFCCDCRGWLSLLAPVVEVPEFNPQEQLMKAITTWKVSLFLCHCF